jgi:hypothetical protein
LLAHHAKQTRADAVRNKRLAGADGLSQLLCRRQQVASIIFSWGFFFGFWFLAKFNRHLPQLPDGVVTDLRRLGHAADADAESPTTQRVTTSNDPYNLGHSIKTDAEIAELHSRKQGKRLANYHRKQNDVSVLPSSFYHLLTLHLTVVVVGHAQLITSLLKPMEEHTEDARNEEDLSRLPVSPYPSYQC